MSSCRVSGLIETFGCDSDKLVGTQSNWMLVSVLTFLATCQTDREKREKRQKGREKKKKKEKETTSETVTDREVHINRDRNAELGGGEREI